MNIYEVTWSNFARKIVAVVIADTKTDAAYLAAQDMEVDSVVQIGVALPECPARLVCLQITREKQDQERV